VYLIFTSSDCRLEYKRDMALADQNVQNEYRIAKFTYSLDDTKFPKLHLWSNTGEGKTELLFGTLPYSTYKVTCKVSKN
jgi:hypothetical protein